MIITIIIIIIIIITIIGSRFSGFFRVSPGSQFSGFL